MSGHLDGPPPGPPDPPYIPGDLGAPSPEEFARRRASSEPRPENPPVSPTPEERNPYAPSADWKPGQDTFTSQAAGIWAEGFAAGRAAERGQAWRWTIHVCPKGHKSLEPPLNGVCWKCWPGGRGPAEEHTAIRVVEARP